MVIGGSNYLTNSVNNLSTWDKSILGVGGIGPHYFGEHITSAGDIDQDGYDDFLVSETRARDLGLSSGRVHLFRGGSASQWGINMSASIADVIFIGTNAVIGDHLFGMAIAGIGDIDQNGFDDIAISAKYGQGGLTRGSVYLILDPDATIWKTVTVTQLSPTTAVSTTTESGINLTTTVSVSGPGTTIPTTVTVDQVSTTTVSNDSLDLGTSLMVLPIILAGSVYRFYTNRVKR